MLMQLQSVLMLVGLNTLRMQEYAAIVSKDGLEPPTDSYKETVLPIKLFRLA